MKIRTLYSMLDLLPSASPEDIEKAFGLLKEQFSQQQLDSDENARSRMLGAQRAYDILRDPEARAAYDKKLGKAGIKVRRFARGNNSNGGLAGRDTAGNLPRWVQWITRSIGYGVGLVIVLALLIFMARGRLAENSLECARKPGIFEGDRSALANSLAMRACLEASNGFLENLFMRPVHKALLALPNAPCKYVGVWHSSQPGCSYKVSLREDGTFVSDPLICNMSSDSFEGSWGVYQDKMVWMYNQGPTWPPDINPIQVANASEFVLVERNGSHTAFKRIDALRSGVCP